MPFTVITLKKVPNSLRGDLTRWMQEIATGVYVGNYNTKVREYLWKRITDSVGQGEAAMCYSCRNEIGYSFCTCNTGWQVVDYDGIPLVIIPSDESLDADTEVLKSGFSDASKFRNARRICGNPVIVFLDLETTGVNEDTDQIIEIGALKVSEGEETKFHRLISANVHVPDSIYNLTGISDEMLKGKDELKQSIIDLEAFIKGTILVGYNIAFDIKFLNRAFQKFSLEPIHNKFVDLMLEAKKKNSFQSDYKFVTTLRHYGIDQDIPHRALEDAILMQSLYQRMGLNKH